MVERKITERDSLVVLGDVVDEKGEREKERDGEQGLIEL